MFEKKKLIFNVKIQDLEVYYDKITVFKFHHIHVYLMGIQDVDFLKSFYMTPVAQDLHNVLHDFKFYTYTTEKWSKG